MTTQPLLGKTVAILVANGFEETEMTEPQRALLAAGATCTVVSPEQALVNGWHGRAWGHYFPVDVALSVALAADFDALLVPGGRRSVEKLAGLAHTKRFIRGFADGNKPVAMIGHAPSLLALAERAAGRTVAGNAEINETIEQAGATVSDEAMATDRNLITARDESDMTAFKQAVVKLVTELTANLADAA